MKPELWGLLSVLISAAITLIGLYANQLIESKKAKSQEKRDASLGKVDEQTSIKIAQEIQDKSLKRQKELEDRMALMQEEVDRQKELEDRMAIMQEEIDRLKYNGRYRATFIFSVGENPSIERMTIEQIPPDVMAMAQ